MVAPTTQESVVKVALGQMPSENKSAFDKPVQDMKNGANAAITVVENTIASFANRGMAAKPEQVQVVDAIKSITGDKQPAADNTNSPAAPKR